uniref:CASP-like protein n=1 Tax=Oryza meridionalis TaxID=40149 RepID=A0A0E0F857_9ORYZ
MARAKSSSSCSGRDGASLALRIATVALSVVSAVMTATAAAQPAAGGAAPTSGGVSYSDYSSLRYSLAATVICAALQAAAVWLEASGKAGEAKAAASLAELVDTAAQVLLYSSAALSFAVDDFGTCGRRVAGVCAAAGAFCLRVRASGAASLSAGVALSASLYLKDVPVSGERKPEPRCGHGCHCHH